MKIYLATISHKHGTNMYAGGTKEELLHKLAGYCRDQPLTHWCGSAQVSEERLNAMTDLEVVEAYFQDHPSEYVEEDCDEISEQIWLVTPGNPNPSKTFNLGGLDG